MGGSRGTMTGSRGGTIAALARVAAASFGAGVAFVVGAGEAASFAQIDDLAGRFASGLTAGGLRRGDRVVIHLPNCLEWVVAYHAAARLGAVVVPANILL